MDLQRVQWDKESSNVESLHNCTGLRASSGRRIPLPRSTSEKLGLTGYAKILTMAAWKWLPAVTKGRWKKINAVVKSGGPRSACGEVLSEPHHPSGVNGFSYPLNAFTGLGRPAILVACCRTFQEQSVQIAAIAFLFAKFIRHRFYQHTNRRKY